MGDIQYIGESIWIGFAARLFIILSFSGALFGAISYIFSARDENKLVKSSWSKLGTIGFFTHGIATLSLIGLIFFAMMTKHYEYSYVFEHVSDDLPMKYILSAFWEGQEGSFMLWMFWHIILGTILWKTAGKWTSRVLAVILLAEVFLASMLLGIYLPFTVEDIKIGSNPMVLIREMTEAPIFTNANYLSLIKGRGLNPLLQNYWNVIHPPTLFLGFASTIVPFAYAIAGLWSKEDNAWLRIGLRWGLFSAGVLGIGILMGSLWAYEALSFGGYWAWDPVENTSLVPWIILVAGVHTNMIANNTGYALRSTYVFYIMGFLLVLYSTLLTRSGILGDTSAHAFTEMGLEWQLTLFIMTFIVGAWALYFFRYKTISEPKKEESISSREFWMFIGSLILAFSGILITGSSSLPVFNTLMKVFNPDYIGNVLKDPIEHYNKYQLWIAVFITMIAGFSIFLSYRRTNNIKKVSVSLIIFLALSAAGTYLLSKWIALPSWQFVVLAFGGVFTTISNTAYLFSTLKINPKLSMSAISHIGFGLMVIGLLASGLNSYHLNNPFLFKGISSQEGFEEKYIQLIKNRPLYVRGHLVNYESDTLIGRERYYTIDFKKVDKDLNVIDSFKTRPHVLYSNDFAKTAAFNPDTRHYSGLDIFTCVVNLPPQLTDVEKQKEMEDTLKYINYDLALGDTLRLEMGNLVINKLNFEPTHPEYQKNNHDIGYELEYSFTDKVGKTLFEYTTAMGLKNAILYKYPSKIESEGLRIRPGDKLIDNLLTAEQDLKYKEFKIKRDVEVGFEDMKVTIIGFTKEISHPAYEKQEGDIAIAANVQIKKGNKIFTAKPVYLIRGSSPSGLKDYIPELGLHVRLTGINPQSEEFEIKMAIDDRKSKTIPIEIAENVPRSDYIILEAKVFPGINYYWVGCLMMMLGLLGGWIFKLRERRTS